MLQPRKPGLWSVHSTAYVSRHGFGATIEMIGYGELEYVCEI